MNQLNYRFYKLAVTSLLVGIIAGCVGIFLGILLRIVQHVAYGYSLDVIMSDVDFLDGVRAASSQRRVLVLTCCGLIAALGWWGIRRYGKPLVRVADVVSGAKSFPPVVTTLHAILQIITVGLGSPLGRETAPRELAGLLSGWVSEKIGLSAKDTRVMIACGAGAGFAAIYNIPLAGAMFVLEVLLCTFRWSVLIPAFVSSALAVAISWVGLGNVLEFHIAPFNISYSLVFWSVCIGPIFGLCAYWFMRVASAADIAATKHSFSITYCVLNFVIIGLFAIYFPAILGNGKNVIHIEFDSIINIYVTLIFLILRVVVTWTSMRAGAHGGLLTPSLANGALLGVLLGSLWSFIWPGVSPSIFAIIGATTFLASAQKMPITAIILISWYLYCLPLVGPLVFTRGVKNRLARFRFELW